MKGLNKKTVALTEEQYKEIISTIRNGFVCSDGHIVKPNNRIATALSLGQSENAEFFRICFGDYKSLSVFADFSFRLLRSEERRVGKECHWVC